MQGTRWDKLLNKKLLLIGIVFLVIPIIFACKEFYKPNSNVDVFDVIEEYGVNSTCHISLYNSTHLFYENLTMQQIGYRYNYSFGRNLSQGTYRAAIECQKDNSANSNCTDLYLGECNFVVEGEGEMASLSVTIFVLVITGSLFALGILANPSRNPVANIIMKRVCIELGLFLMSLNTAIVITIASYAGLGIDQELFRYLWIINWSIYLFMVFIAWTTLTNVLKMMQQMAKSKRMEGEDYGEESDYD